MTNRDGEATIWIYDPIGGTFEGGITAKGIRDKLHNMRGVTRLTIRINSPGGEVDDAIAIHTLLSAHDAEKVVKVDGIAASAAATIAMVGDSVHVAPGGIMMVHNPWSIVMGDHRALMHAATVSEKYRNNTAEIYARRTGRKITDIVEAMDSETWFTASEAVEWGLADELGPAPDSVPVVDMELFPYKNTPSCLIPGGAKHTNIDLMRRRLAIAKSRLAQTKRS